MVRTLTSDGPAGAPARLQMTPAWGSLRAASVTLVGMRWRGPLALGALWVSAAAVATAVGLVAVGLVAGEVGGPVSTPLSQDNVQDALAGVTPTSASPRATATATLTPRATSASVTLGALRTVRTRGGVVSARCENRAPNLLYASPAEGWRTERSRDTDVRFERGDQEVVIRLSCSGNRLLVSVRDDDTSSPAPSPDESSDSPEPSDSPDPDETDDSSGSSDG